MTQRTRRMANRNSLSSYNLFLHGGHDLGGEKLDLPHTIGSGPIDESVQADLNDQACQFFYPIVRRANEDILHGTGGDESHDVVDAANVLWLTTYRYGCVADTLLHLWKAFRLGI